MLRVYMLVSKLVFSHCNVVFLTSSMHQNMYATCSAHHILVDFVILIFYNAYK
jgi:hypothetical protein